MSNSTSSSSVPKRRRTNLISNFRVRNGGSNTAFLSPSTPGLSATNSGSDTEDEGDEELAQHYLDKMTDDTDRPTSTVFGKGVDVWKDEDGTIYADLTDEMKKKQRDEEIWGKKRKRRGWKADLDGPLKAPPFDSSLGGQQVPPFNPSLRGQGYTDGNISCPPLPSVTYPSLIPPTPTASEWELFPVSDSLSGSRRDFKTPEVYRPLKPLPKCARGAGEQQGAASYPFMQGIKRTEDLHTDTWGPVQQGNQHTEEQQGAAAYSFMKGIQYGNELHAAPPPPLSRQTETLRNPTSKPAGQHTGDLRARQHTETLQPSSIPAPQHTTTQLSGAFPTPSQVPQVPQIPTAPNGGFFSNVFGAARHIVSDSFGAVGGGASEEDRFDERPYRLGQARDGTAAEKRGATKKKGGDEGGKLDPFKGRPWLGRG